MRGTGVAAAVAVALMASAAPGQVRPGWQGFAARFDGDQPVVLAGEVTSVDWTHGVGPKVVLTLDSDDGGRPPTSWTVEGNFTDLMQTRGFTKDNLKPGIRVSVRGYRAKDGSQVMSLREMTFADGRRLNVGLSH